MKPKTIKPLVISSLVILALLLGSSVYALTPATFQAANLVLGQTNFVSGGLGGGDAGLDFPEKVAVDSASGKVFVADRNNHRVLRFADAATLANGDPAEAVLGQANFTDVAANRGGAVGANTMNEPSGLFVDADGQLWVADAFNNRVLRFDGAATKANGDPADGVLGQANFTDNDPNRGGAPAANTMVNPSDVFVDAVGKWLWVADFGNSRVLRFNNAATKGNGDPANGVLGQANFTDVAANRGGAPAANTMSFPVGVFETTGGTLWVADTGNHRVLYFLAAFVLADGDPADGVLGQANFTDDAANRGGAPAANTMNGPIGVFGDAGGRLWVGDSANNRVLWFNSALGLANGDPANGVLGQPSFTAVDANNGGVVPSARSLNGPRYVFYDDAKGVLWVGDGANNRVLRFDEPPEMAVEGNGLVITNGNIIPDTAHHTDFGNVVLGQELIRTFTIRNTGKTELILDGAPLVEVTGADAVDFTIVAQPTTPVPPGGSTTFEVRFTPSVVGLRTTTVSIANNDTDENPYNFAIQGTGIAPEIEVEGNGAAITNGDFMPETADDTDFGNVVVGQPLSHNFVIRNTGNADLILNGTPLVAVTGLDAGDFTVFVPPTTPLAPNATTTFQVRFTPSVAGVRTATLNIPNNDTDKTPYTFVIQGTGVTPEIDVEGNGAAIANNDTMPETGDDSDFGNVTLNQEVIHTFTIRNTGNADLDLNGTPRVAVTGVGDFTVSVLPITPLAPNATTTFAVRFKPSVAGVRMATLTILNNDANENPFTFAIKGTGSNLPLQTLRVTKAVGAGTGDGKVTSAPAGINCGATCAFAFPDNTQVTLTAMPAGDAVFEGWGVDCAGVGACVVTLNTARNVSATFRPIHKLTVTNLSNGVPKPGNGDGKVISAPGGIDCSPTCAFAFPDNTQVTLSATPNAGFTFAGWFGGTCTGVGLCKVPMVGQKSVTANFNQAKQTLNVFTVGAGAGSVSSVPAGITCGAACTFDFNTAALVTLTPKSADGSTFGRWNGACTGTGACVVTMDRLKTVIATFNKVGTQRLKVARVGDGAGSISSVPVGINCGATCVFAFAENAKVTLTANKADGSTFGGWSNDCTGLGVCQVTLNESKTVIATFNPLGGQTKKLEVFVVGAGGGRIISEPAGITCGATCKFDFPADERVTLRVTSDGASVFAGWGPPCIGADPCQVTLNDDKTMIATFQPVGAVNQSLAVGRAGLGEGIVSSAPGGVTCAGACTAGFVANQPVTLMATSTGASLFTGWEGDCAGTGPCHVTMDGLKIVVATFELPATRLSLYLPLIKCTERC